MLTTVREMLLEHYLAGHVEFHNHTIITPDRRQRVMRSGAPARRSATNQTPAAAFRETVDYPSK